MTAVTAPTTDVRKPSTLTVHLALICCQTLFGVGAVVGKLGLPATNPVLFAFIREALAAPILGVIAYSITPKGVSLASKDIPMFMCAGLCLFANQFGFIVGTKLSSPVIGAAWQPSQPLFTAAIAILMGWEAATPCKLGGILLAFGGAAFLIFFHTDLKNGKNELLGNACFFINCLGTALYVICAKPLLRVYSSSVVTAWAYLVAAVFMAATALIVNNVKALLSFVCSDCHGHGWEVPDGAILALAYWIIFNSVACYLLMTWSTQYVDPSIVLCYTALQPFTAVVLSGIIISTGYTHTHKNVNLQEPGWNGLGAIGIVGAMFLQAYEARQQYRAARAADPQYNALADIDVQGDSSAIREPR